MFSLEVDEYALRKILVSANIDKEKGILEPYLFCYSALDNRHLRDKFS